MTRTMVLIPIRLGAKAHVMYNCTLLESRRLLSSGVDGPRNLVTNLLPFRAAVSETSGAVTETRSIKGFESAIAEEIPIHLLFSLGAIGHWGLLGLVSGTSYAVTETWSIKGFESASSLRRSLFNFCSHWGLLGFRVLSQLSADSAFPR